MNELEVNLPGAEVIVRMPSEMIAMQQQFGKILEALIEEIRSAAGRKGDIQIFAPPSSPLKMSHVAVVDHRRKA